MPVELQRRVEPMLIIGAGSAFVAGATGSVHCALMCGPLASLSSGQPTPVRAAWHAGRVFAYSTIGLLLGAIGQTLTNTISLSVTPVLPWVMALGLIITGLDLARHVPAIPGVSEVSKRLTRLGSRLSPVGRSLTLGAATPFLPCGLLYGVFLAAAASGSSWSGAAIVGAFSLGAVPALVAAQVGAHKFAAHPTLALVLRRSIPLTAAAIIIWRAVAAMQGNGECH